MQKQMAFSNTTFWEWTTAIIQKEVLLFDKMVNIEHYVTNRKYRKNSKAGPSMFRKLKESVPTGYFHEMEYCALAYSVVFGKVFPPLTQYIEQLAYIEWLQYVEPAQLDYRDHFVHMLKVAFVSEQIFESSLGEEIVEWQFKSKHFQDWLKEENIFFNEDRKKDILHAAIFLAAILHDFGYGYKFIRGYEERLFDLNMLGSDSIDITKSHSEIIQKSVLARYISEHHQWFSGNDDVLKTNQRKTSISCGFIRDCLPLNHSVSSALMVLGIAQDLFHSRVINSDLYIAFQIAAEACLLHDLTNPYKYLHFHNASNDHKHFLDSSCHEKVPAAALLIFADEMSMWRRPKINIQPNGFNALEGRLDYTWKDTVYPKEIIINVDETQHIVEIKLENELQKKYLVDILGKCGCFTTGTSTDLSMFAYRIYLN